MGESTTAYSVGSLRSGITGHRPDRHIFFEAQNEAFVERQKVDFTLILQAFC
jgi:hypothetical protein